MLLSTGERISCALVAMALHDLGHDARLVHRVAGRHPHRHRAHQGPHHRDPPRTACVTPSTTGGIVLVAGFQGVSDRPQRHHARPRRQRHHRRRPGGGARRRRLRDLHRRERRLHRRPAHRARGPQAARRHPRGDARDGGLRVEGADAALGRVRPQLRRARCTSAPPSSARRAPGSPRRRQDGEGHRLRNRPQERRGQDHGDRGARTRPASPRASSRRWPRPTSTSTRSSRTSAPTASPTSRSPCPCPSWGRPSRSSPTQGRARPRQGHERRPDRQGHAGRGRDEVQPGRGGQDVPDAGPRGGQHPDDRHLDHQHHRGHRPRRGGAGRAGAARRVRPGRRGRAPRDGGPTRRGG